MTRIKYQLTPSPNWRKTKLGCGRKADCGDDAKTQTTLVIAIKPSLGFEAICLHSLKGIASDRLRKASQCRGLGKEDVQPIHISIFSHTY